MPRKVFVAGEILTAADVNTNLMDQAVMVFDDDDARAAAIPSPIEGMVTYLKDTDSLEQFTGAAFVPVSQPGILQVVSTTKTDTFSTSSGTPVAVTGATVTITPSSTSSKVFVSFDFAIGSNFQEEMGVQLLRGATVIGAGAAAGSRFQAITTVGVAAGNRRTQASGQFLDSPSTTSATTYSISVMGQGGTVFIGRGSADGDSGSQPNNRTSLTITAVEVAG